MMMHNPAHPGEILQEYLHGLKLTVSDMAKHVKVSRVSMSRILHGKAGISADMSLRLAAAFGTSPDFWLKMQVQYDLAQAVKHRRVKIAALPRAEQKLCA